LGEGHYVLARKKSLARERPLFLDDTIFRPQRLAGYVVILSPNS